MASANGSGVPFRRRAVSCPCERYPVGARWSSHPDCGLPRSASPKQSREPKRRARVGHHHVARACMGCCGYHRDCGYHFDFYHTLALVAPSRLVERFLRFLLWV